MKIKVNAKHLFFIINLLACVLAVQAQTTGNQSSNELPNPYEATKDYIKQNNYITPLFDLKANEEKYLASPQHRMLYLEEIIQLEGYVGNYDEAYRYENLLLKDFPSTKNRIAQYQKDFDDLKTSPVADFKMVDAIAAIEAAAERERVVMINEEHRTPFHRALTLELLHKLYAKGFRYFAAETVQAKDAELNKRGYPTQATGYYTADPLYADVIRRALRLGYKIVPYESSDPNCRPTEANPELCDDRRERGQAQNLYERILQKDSQAKIFVHAGRGHNSKAELSEKFNFMGYYFKKLSGIEPFTIDQLRFSERRNNPAMEHPLYRLLTKENLLRKPSVYQSADGKFYTLGAGYNMVIFHPRISYQNGRATFLPMNGERRAVQYDLKKLKIAVRKQIYTGQQPILVQAFFAEESADAVPVDQIIVHPNQKIPPLMLPTGVFRIRAIDRAGKLIAEYQK